MTTLADIRAKYPDYGDMTDTALADAVHGKFYSDIPRDEFNVKIGLAAPDAPAPTDIVKRGSILPLGRTADGNIVPALPEPVENARKLVMEIMRGEKTADQVSGKEMLDVISTLGFIPGVGGGAAAGTGRGVARARAEPVAAREAIAEAPAVAPRSAPVEAGVTPAEAARTQATSFYKQAEDAGVSFRSQPIKDLSSDIATTVAKAGIDPTLHPRATAAASRIESVAAELIDQAPLSFERLEILRRVVNAAGKTKDPDEGRLVGLIRDKIDDFVENLSAKDVASGDPKLAAEAIVKARELWGVVAKLDKVAELIDRAATSASGFSGSGFENALRTEFRAFAKNAAEMRRWSPEEQRAVKLVARGTKPGNAARMVGKLAPRGSVSAGVSGGAGALIGTSLGVGPYVGGAAAFGVGEAGRATATALTKRAIAKLEKLIAERGDSKMATEALSRSRQLLSALGAATMKSAPAATSAEVNRK